jgi:hypothetical protein
LDEKTRVLSVYRPAWSSERGFEFGIRAKQYHERQPQFPTLLAQEGDLPLAMEDAQEQSARSPPCQLVARKDLGEAMPAYRLDHRNHEGPRPFPHLNENLPYELGKEQRQQSQ